MAYPFHLAFPVRDLDETRRFYEAASLGVPTWMLRRPSVRGGLRLSARHRADRVSGA